MNIYETHNLQTTKSTFNDFHVLMECVLLYFRSASTRLAAHAAHAGHAALCLSVCPVGESSLLPRTPSCRWDGGRDSGSASYKTVATEEVNLVRRVGWPAGGSYASEARFGSVESDQCFGGLGGIGNDSALRSHAHSDADHSDPQSFTSRSSLSKRQKIK